MVPGGIRFLEPETKRKWKETSASFDMVTAQIIEHRRANRSLAHKSVDPVQVAAELDTYNAVFCQRMGWIEYVQHDPPGPMGKGRPPQRAAPVASRAGVKHAVDGAFALADLFGPKEKPVEKPLAEWRAFICRHCPQNVTQGWQERFTDAAGRIVRRMLSFAKDASLVTEHDAQIGACAACKCPLKLKVWAPLDFILEKTGEDVLERMPETCWIKNRDNGY